MTRLCSWPPISREALDKETDHGSSKYCPRTRRVCRRFKLVVGHSYGGVVITEAGNDPTVSGLVYVAAFAPDANQSIGEISSKFPKPPGIDALRPLPDGYLLLTPKGIEEDFAQDREQRPHDRAGAGASDGGEHLRDGEQSRLEPRRDAVAPEGGGGDYRWSRPVRRSTLVGSTTGDSRPPHVVTEVPVSCVEKGRWQARPGAFQASSRTVSLSVRTGKLKRVTASAVASAAPAYDADQGAVWATVDDHLRRTHVSSRTASYADAADARRQRSRRSCRPSRRGPGRLMCP